MAQKYQVRVSYEVWNVFEIEAEDEIEAMELAEDMAADMSFDKMQNSHESTDVKAIEP